MTIVTDDSNDDRAPHDEFAPRSDSDRLLTAHEKAGKADMEKLTGDDEDPSAEQLVEALEDQERKRTDKLVYEKLKGAGFNGTQWERFCFKHGRHALGKTEGWLQFGDIFTLTRSIGHGVGVDPRARETLRRDELQRQALANVVVFAGLRLWRRRQSVPKQAWRPDGGASLVTSVLNSCIYAFSNEFRKWQNAFLESIDERSTEHEELSNIEYGLDERNKPVPMFPSPEMKLITDDELDRALQRIDDPLIVKIAQLEAQGLTQAQIGREVQKTPRQIEYVLKKLHQQNIRSQMEGNNDD